MSKALTMDQFNDIMNRIKEKHSFGRYGHTKWIKYIRPSFDMRDFMCFSITFRHGSDETTFGQSGNGTMYERIMEWLETK